MPLSNDPAQREKQLANLRGGSSSTRRPGPRFLSETEITEQTAALAKQPAKPRLELWKNATPEESEIFAVIEPDVSLIPSDRFILEITAGCMRHCREVTAWCAAHGRIDQKCHIKLAAIREIKSEFALHELFDSLLCSHAARSRLGFDLSRTKQRCRDLKDAEMDALFDIDLPKLLDRIESSDPSRSDIHV